jgi:hypothetical protein
MLGRDGSSAGLRVAVGFRLLRGVRRHPLQGLRGPPEGRLRLGDLGLVGPRRIHGRPDGVVYRFQIHARTSGGDLRERQTVSTPLVVSLNHCASGRRAPTTSRSSRRRSGMEVSGRTATALADGLLVARQVSGNAFIGGPGHRVWGGRVLRSGSCLRPFVPQAAPRTQRHRLREPGQRRANQASTVVVREKAEKRCRGSPVPGQWDQAPVPNPKGVGAANAMTRPSLGGRV